MASSLGVSSRRRASGRRKKMNKESHAVSGKVVGRVASYVELSLRKGKSLGVSGR
jgi:single-stranded DNA-binding protein